jgi:hypothetical protein
MHVRKFVRKFACMFVSLFASLHAHVYVCFHVHAICVRKFSRARVCMFSRACYMPVFTACMFVRSHRARGRAPSSPTAHCQRYQHISLFWLTQSHQNLTTHRVKARCPRRERRLFASFPFSRARVGAPMYGFISCVYSFISIAQFGCSYHQPRVYCGCIANKNHRVRAAG